MWLNPLSENESESDRLHKFLKDLHALDSSAPAGDKPITIIMNHDGGEIYAGMAIYDAIMQAANHITIIVRGSASSMGAVILQAADHRIVSEHSIVMIHKGQVGYSGHEADVESWRNFERKYLAKIDNILVQRIKHKKPRFNKKALDKLQLFDRPYTAEDAVKEGLADEVLANE